MRLDDDGFADGVPRPIRDFLRTPSDARWATALAADPVTMLNDHANCELKAASTALSLMHRYPLNETLVYRMSRLAREELRHFEQVRKRMQSLGIAVTTLSASRYAAGLRAECANAEPQRLVDTLIVGALIEARSCERFALIGPMLDAPLAAFYAGLLASEARHFEHYLELAELAARDAGLVEARIAALGRAERRLVSEPDASLRFHSGPPAA